MQKKAHKSVDFFSQYDIILGLIEKKERIL